MVFLWYVWQVIVDSCWEKIQVKIPLTEKVMPIIKKIQKIQKKTGVILKCRAIISNPL